ncbi:MAG: isopeptide-forming domain-containing fimbrial protein [Eubacterium sp.]|nr:isopeptide-forming domain-containing fimbrial protein [Eubacterium sp.]
MKKTFKRFLAVILAVFMVLACAIPAMAEDTTKYTLTINNNENLPAMNDNQFVAYQIFKGDLYEYQGKKQLINVAWGNDVDGTNLLAALKATTAAPISSAFAKAASAADVAHILEDTAIATHDFLQAFATIVKANIKTDADGIGSKANATGTSSTITAPVGYYFIDEPNVPTKNGSGAVTAEFALQLFGRDTNQPISIKADIPTVTKTIVKDDDSEVKGDDAGVTDTVKFKLVGTLPEDYAVYDAYRYIFHDTMTAGFDYKAPVSIKIGDDVEIPQAQLASYFSTSGKTLLTVKFADLKKLNPNLAYGQKIVVVYEATVNTDAVLESSGNQNTVYIEYTNNPNATGTGSSIKPPEGPGKPGQPGTPEDPTNPDDPNGPETGETVKDLVYVYSFGLDITKIGNDIAHKNGLDGAGFILSRTVNGVTQYAIINNGTFTAWGTKAQATTITSANGGKIYVKGLDAGTYTLTEVEAPDHYVALSAPIIITISSNIDANGVLQSVSIKATLGEKTLTDKTYDKNDTTGVFSSGLLPITIENQRIPILPGTGGIGTTVFYVLGGVLIAGVAVFAVISGRKKREQESL